MLSVFVVVLSLSLTSFVFAANPNGAKTVTSVSNTTAATDSAGSHAAYSGNISEVTLTADLSSGAWAGYYGNVTGIIELADSSNNVLYNWTKTDAVSGEVFASINSSITWATIGCFNLSADNALELADLQAWFNIGADDGDRINLTFDDTTHSSFTIASQTFNANQCNSTDLYGPGGAATFQEVLLLDASNRTVYASIIDDDTAGFDSALYDFEMIVPEDGHSGDASATVYYFYVDISA